MRRVFLALCVCLYAAGVCPGAAGGPTGTKCQRTSGAPSCVCQSSELDGVIDLTSMAASDGKPRYVLEAAV